VPLRSADEVEERDRKLFCVAVEAHSTKVLGQGLPPITEDSAGSPWTFRIPSQLDRDLYWLFLFLTGTLREKHVPNSTVVACWSRRQTLLLVEVGWG